MRDFHDLKVWGKAHQLVLAVYKCSIGFPRMEIYALTNQLRRAAISIASNIAEGSGRVSQAEFGHFLQIAMGSACEVQYDLLLARDLAFLKDAEFEAMDKDVAEVKRMLALLIQKLKAVS